MPEQLVELQLYLRVHATRWGRMPWRSPLLFSVLALFCLILLSCGPGDSGGSGQGPNEQSVGASFPREPIIDLKGDWRFRPGDDPAWASPVFDDSDWTLIRIPTGFGRHDVDSEMAWYRRQLDVGPGLGMLTGAEIAELRLAITVGKVDSAYQVFAGGYLLGGVGQMPPDPRMDYDRHGIYRIPAAAVSPEGRVLIALRVWKSPETRSSVGGPHGGPYWLGPMRELVERELKSELLSIFLAGWFLLTGLVHLELFRRRPALTGYLWFALLCGSFAIYSFLRSQWKYQLTDQFLVLKELEHLVIYSGLVLFIQVMWPILGQKISRFLRAVQGLCGLAVLLVALPGLRLNVMLLPFWQIAMMWVLVLFIVHVFRRLREGHPEARYVAVGALVALVGFVYETGIDRGFYIGPRLADLSFVFFVVCLALSLAGQFARVYSELETLRRNEREAAAASRAKTEFLANMSHEIRTPMTGILGAADLMLRQDLDPGTRRHAEIINASAQSLLGLIDDILDFSKVESGRMKLERTDFSVSALVEGVAQLLQPQADAKGIRLRSREGADVPDLVSGDPLRLRQVLINLVANGVKFTPEGEVRLSVERIEPPEAEPSGPADAEDRAAADDGIWLRFKVDDTGIGIAGDVRESLFEPFSQADTSTARRFGGTGLGLSISRRLVELMSGRLRVESEPGRGSLFWFDVFLGKPEGKPRAAELGAEAGPAKAAFAAKILLAEDTPISRIVLEEQLVALGYSVETADNGLQVLELLKAQRFDLVLMDCQMPELDGYETTRRIREKETTGRRLPVIALTAHAMAGDREKCLAAGMDDYLRKPCTEQQLAQVIRSHLAGSWLGRGIEDSG